MLAEELGGVVPQVQVMLGGKEVIRNVPHCPTMDAFVPVSAAGGPV